MRCLHYCNFPENDDVGLLINNVKPHGSHNAAKF